MIRFRLRELVADKGFRENRVVTMAEVAEATGIHRMTLSKIANNRGYHTSTELLDKLCGYFDCQVGQIAEYVRDEQSAALLSGDGDHR